jgi:hypothetical protein
MNIPMHIHIHTGILAEAIQNRISKPFYSIVLYCIVLCCIVLYCIIPIVLYYTYCIVLYCIVLYCIVLYCIVLYCIVLYCIVLYCIVLYCIVLYCIILWSKTTELSETRCYFQALTACCSETPRPPPAKRSTWVRIPHWN